LIRRTAVMTTPPPQNNDESSGNSENGAPGHVMLVRAFLPRRQKGSEMIYERIHGTSSPLTQAQRGNGRGVHDRGDRQVVIPLVVGDRGLGR
jgi:hypothetical protein